MTDEAMARADAFVEEFCSRYAPSLNPWKRQNLATMLAAAFAQVREDVLARVKQGFEWNEDYEEIAKAIHGGK